MNADKHVTVVVPAYNEAEVLPSFHQRLTEVLAALGCRWQVLYVDDGSADATWAVIRDLAADPADVGGIRLSRNFGKEAALSAGLDQVDPHSDAVVVIDADLQDPPELIPAMIAEWQAGFDVVYAVRQSRAGETRFKRFTAAGFYRMMSHVSDTPIPRNTGDFRLLSRRALEALAQLPERQRFMKGLFAWIGFEQTGIHYDRQPRHGGRSKWSYWRLWNLALEGITSFSTLPLRVATWAGLSTSVAAFVYAVWVIVKALIWGEPVQGYPSLMTVMLFLGGMQLLALGAIGEYVGRIYAESKQRPLYLISERFPAGIVAATTNPLHSKHHRSHERFLMRQVKHLLEGKGQDVATTRPDDSVFKALEKMAELGIGALVVVDGDKLVGLMSERDYARKIILKNRHSRDTQVAEIMTTQVTTVGLDASVAECMSLCTTGRMRHLPVMQDGRLVGLVSIGDLVKAVIDDQSQEIEHLQSYIAG